MTGDKMAGLFLEAFNRTYHAASGQQTYNPSAMREIAEEICRELVGLGQASSSELAVEVWCRKPTEASVDASCHAVFVSLGLAEEFAEWRSKKYPGLCFELRPARPTNHLYDYYKGGVKNARKT